MNKKFTYELTILERQREVAKIEGHILTDPTSSKEQVDEIILLMLRTEQLLNHHMALYRFHLAIEPIEPSQEPSADATVQ